MKAKLVEATPAIHLHASVLAVVAYYAKTAYPTPSLSVPCEPNPVHSLWFLLFLVIACIVLMALLVLVLFLQRGDDPHPSSL